MYLVHAVDSFCDLKLWDTTGNGEKKLYLSNTDSIHFACNYLGINVANGVNFYQYNDEVRARTIGYRGFITKSNLSDVFSRSINEYSDTSKYRTNLDALRRNNQHYLDNMNDIEEFTIDCSISKDRIYIGSQDFNWRAIPSFCIPRESCIRITNTNNCGILEFEIIYPI